MTKRMPMGLRVTALVVGLLAALAPAALFAYDAGSSKGEEARIVAQATATATGTPRAATATGTAAPGAPKTGNAGLASGQTGAAAIALLGVIALAGVAGGRLMTSRRS
ncbi:MAG: hypothetical protein FJ035_06295 [Chloroflexi bacterium]|nr:hypothetical protein [Chloroflexota bacterium]